MIKNPQAPAVNNLCDLLIDASIDRVMAIDLEWKIIAWNRTSEIISGISKEKVMHKHLLDVFPFLVNDEAITKAFEEAMLGRNFFLLPDQNFEHRRFCENHFIPLKDKQGTLIGVMNLMHDVSHRIKGELELQKLHLSLKHQYEQLEKANAELTIFTSITGKDLKDPVRKLYTGLEMLVNNDGKNLSDGSKAGLRRMQASLTKMSLLLDDILAFSSVANFDEKFVPLQLDEILADAIAFLSVKIADKKAIIQSEPLPSYTGSREMLYYLFYNIIDNALKFQNEGTVPVIKITYEIVKGKNNPSTKDSHNLPLICISFIDNGIGFSSEDSKQIFKMFERLHTRKQFAGAGIGLTISQKIAEAHGGYIEAESKSGSGSVFRCFLGLRS